jgi:NDP-sugar pyrophosphorylase family protein
VPDRPKSLAPVGGQPFLGYVLRQLAEQGIGHVTICTGYGSEEVRRFADQGNGWGLEIDFSEERDPLGTAGALRLAMDRFTDDQFLVLNGDSFFDVQFDRLMETHRSMKAEGTIAVRWTHDPGRFGSIEVDDDGRVTSFREKVEAGPALINGGIYVLERSVLADLPLGEVASLERDVFPALTARAGGRGLATVAFDGWFTDIGVPADYASVDSDPEPILAALSRGARC